MRVQFEFTQDDLIDVSKRSLARSKALRSTKRKELLSIAFLAWLFVFLFFYGTPVKGAIIGLIAAALSALFYPVLERRGLEKRMRKIAQETLGDANPFLCEVEIRPDGVWVRQMNCQVLHEWPSVEEIKETPDSVDLFTRNGSGVVVRNKAFTSPEERLRFIEEARAGLNSTQS